MAAAEPATRTTASARPTAGVIIAAYDRDRWPDTLRAIRSVQAQSRQPDEIIVVIDGNPALLERARQALPDVLVLANAGAQWGVRRPEHRCARVDQRRGRLPRR